jgi:hypothetical protein
MYGKDFKNIFQKNNEKAMVYGAHAAPYSVVGPSANLQTLNFPKIVMTFHPIVY